MKSSDGPIRTDFRLCTAQYLQHFPAELPRVQPFIQFLERNEGARLFDRKNFDGHITASAFVVSADGRRLLLLHHKSLGKWLQPGGHVDVSDESLLAAALREVQEETGLGPDILQHLAMHPNTEVPFDIDSHDIPANPYKQEAAHVHHDFRFLFRCKGEAELAIDPLESLGFQWIDFGKLRHDALFGAMVAKMEQVQDLGRPPFGKI